MSIIASVRTSLHVKVSPDITSDLDTSTVRLPFNMSHSIRVFQHVIAGRWRRRTIVRNVVSAASSLCFSVRHGDAGVEIGYKFGIDPTHRE